jgi:hypothetical protein
MSESNALQIMKQAASLLKTKTDMRNSLIGKGLSVPLAAAFSLYPGYLDMLQKPDAPVDAGGVTLPAIPDKAGFGGGLTNKMAYRAGEAAALYPEFDDFPETPTFIVEDSGTLLEWKNAVQGSDYEIVGIRAGNYDLGAAGIALGNAGTKRVYAQNGAVITYSGADFAFSYTSPRLTEDYSIKNLSVRITNAEGRAVKNIHTMKHFEVLDSKADNAVQGAAVFSHSLINMTAAFIPIGAGGFCRGVYVGAVTDGYSVNVSGNVIAGITAHGAAAAYCYGIHDTSAAADSHSVENNIIGAITAYTDYVYAVYSKSNVKNNKIGRVAGLSAACKLYGVYCDADDRQILGNETQLLDSGGDTGAVIYAIYAEANCAVNEPPQGRVLRYLRRWAQQSRAWV